MVFVTVPKSSFERMTEFAFGGIFGFIEQQARASQQIAGYRTRSGYLTRKSGSTRPHFSPAGATPSNLPTLPDGETEIYGTWTTRDPIYVSNWAVNLSLLTFSGMLQNKTKGVPTNEQLKKGIADIRDKNDGKCGEFLDKLRSKLGIKEKFEDLFDALIKKYDDTKGKKGGIAYVDTLSSTRVSIGGSELPADGEYPYNGKDIYGKKRKSAVALKRRAELNGSVQIDGYVNDLIHELIHYAGIGSHERFADAASRVSGGTDLTSDKPLGKDYDDDDADSVKFRKLFSKYCR